MAYRFNIDKTVNCVLAQHFGTFEVTDAANQLNALLSHDEYIPGINLLRDVSSPTLPSEYDYELYRYFSSTVMPSVYTNLGTERKVAWIISNPRDFKIVHQWCVVKRLNELVFDRRPFRSIENAMKWLEIPDGYEVSYPYRSVN